MRDFNQILAEVTAQSDPQRQSVMRSIADLPTQQAAAEAGVNAQKDQAYDDITAGARRKGLGFSGIPLGEQAKYAATTYAPAIANLKSSYNDRQATLEQALAGIGTQNYAQANDIFNNDRSFEEQQRQFNEGLAEQRRQAAATSASNFSPSTASDTPQYLGNDDLRGHLSYLAQKQGNQDAATALKYVGNDGKYYLDPYTTNPKIFKALDALGAVNTWRR